MLSALRCQNARCFDYLFSWFFNTPSYFQRFFLQYSSTFLYWIPYFCVQTFCTKKNCVPALNTYIMEGFGLICTYIFTVFQRGACVPELCIPALNAWKTFNPSTLNSVRCYCVPACFTNNPTFWIIFSILFCMHLHCVPALVTCISIASGGFLDCSGLLLGCSTFWEAFWTALDCFWAFGLL